MPGAAAARRTHRHAIERRCRQEALVRLLTSSLLQFRLPCLTVWLVPIPPVSPHPPIRTCEHIPLLTSFFQKNPFVGTGPASHRLVRNCSLPCSSAPSAKIDVNSRTRTHGRSASSFSDHDSRLAAGCALSRSPPTPIVPLLPVAGTTKW